MTFWMAAIEPLTDDIVTEADADNMRLPFDQGWDQWGVFHGTELVFVSPNYDIVKRTHSALSNLTFIEQVAA